MIYPKGTHFRVIDVGRGHPEFWGRKDEWATKIKALIEKDGVWLLGDTYYSPNQGFTGTVMTTSRSIGGLGRCNFIKAKFKLWGNEDGNQRSKN